MGRVGFGLALGLFTVTVLRVEAALNVAVKPDGEKVDSPFLIGQMLLWRKALIAPASPPKTERPPIPSPSQQHEQQPESQPEPRNFAPHVIYDDVANAPQPILPDYYDAVREEDQRMRMAAATAADAEPVHHQAQAHGSLTFTLADHPEHPEATFEPKSIFVDPAANGERVVAGLAPNDHGGFVPLDEVIDSSNETHDSVFRVARFSDTSATGSVFFTVDGEAGGSAVPIDQIPTFHVAENGDVRPAIVDGETNVPAEHIPHQIPMDTPTRHEAFQPIRTSDYEDQMREKEIDGMKYLFRKRTKPSRDAIPSQESIEIGHFPVFAVDGTTNAGDVTDPRIINAEVQPSWVVLTDDLPWAFSGEEPPPEQSPKSTIVDSDVSTARAHKQIGSETNGSNSGTDLPRPMIATRFSNGQ